MAYDEMCVFSLECISLPVHNARAWNFHDHVVGVDEVAGWTFCQDDAGRVVRRDVLVPVLGEVLRQMTLRDGEVGVPPVELLELAGDGSALQAFLKKQQGLVKRSCLATYHGNTRRQPLLRHVLEHRLLNVLSKIDILKIAPRGIIIVFIEDKRFWKVDKELLFVLDLLTRIAGRNIS